MLVFLFAAAIAGCFPKSGDTEIVPRVITRPVTPKPTPGADPVEKARIAKLYQITAIEARRPVSPDEFAPWLADEDPSVRAAAVLGAGRAGEALGAAGGDPAAFVSAVLALASDKSTDVRGAVAAAIGLLGPAASGQSAAPRAAESNDDVRVRWVRAAGRVAPIPAPPKPGGTPAVAASPEVSLLVRLLEDDALAPAAAWALGVFGLRAERGGSPTRLSDEAVDGLRERYAKTAAADREPYAYALWRLHPSAAAPELRLGLSDLSPLVRGWSARALAAIPGTHARREIVRLLRDPSSDVRVEAARALIKLDDADATAAVELVDLLERSDPPRVRRERIRSGDPHSAVAAMEALGELGFLATAEMLRARLAADSPYLFGAAAVAYAKVAKLGAIPDLAALAEERGRDADWRHRRSIAEALAFVKPKPDAKGETRALPADGGTAAGAISSEVPEAARPLMEFLLGDPDVRVRAAALDSYAALAGADATARLVAVLASSGDVAMLGTAADRLAALDPAPAVAGPALVAALARLVPSDPDTAALLAGPAAKLGGDGATPVLEQAAVSPANGLMLAAAKALRERGREPPAREGAPAGFPDQESFLEAADWTRMTIRTMRGDIRLELRPELAPLTVWRIGTLARAGYFRGIAFHRVVPAFVAQGGDPRGDGWGGPTNESGAAVTIPCELSDAAYAVGTVGMALSGRDTGGSQFFIALTPQPHLESAYTVFGQVIRGHEVVERLQIGDVIEDVTIP